jgi:hypothetical protein
MGSQPILSLVDVQIIAGVVVAACIVLAIVLLAHRR